MHTLAECITAASEGGQSTGEVATLYGLAVTSVEQVLRDEYESRRLRRVGL